jgi:uncharacterized membrane protein
LNWIPTNAKWIEFLIPITILVTAIYNVLVHQFDQPEATFEKKLRLNYFFALIFGLIHGMGFSNFFRSLTMPGNGNQLLPQLFAFNVGVELGQLSIVAMILGSSFFALEVFKVKQREWNLFISGAAAGLALVMALERIPF